MKQALTSLFKNEKVVIGVSPMSKRHIDNNFKYLLHIIEGYMSSPTCYKICRKKRLLLLKNISEIIDIECFDSLLESFIKEHLYLIAVRDFFGLTVLEKGGPRVLYWAMKYHKKEDVEILIKDLFGSKDPPTDKELIDYYLLQSKEFRERLKKNNTIVVIVNTEFKRITLNRWKL